MRRASRTSKNTGVAVLLSALFGLMANEPSAFAEDPQHPAEAKEPEHSAEYEDGLVLYNQDNYAAALTKFRRAYELSRDPWALWYELICAKKLGDYAGYIRLVGEFQALPEGSAVGVVGKDYFDKIPGWLSGAMRLVGPLGLRTDQAGAEVFIDGTSVGKTPLPRPPVLLNIGERKLRVVKAGFKDVEQVVQVEGGTEVQIAVTLERIVHEGRLSVDAGADGQIWVDGKMVGLGRWEGAVASGGHALKVTAPGKVPKEQEVAVLDDQRREIQVTLVAGPSEEWKKWAWVGVGGALLTGTILGGALTARSSGPLVQGTITEKPVPLSFGFGGQL